MSELLSTSPNRRSHKGRYIRAAVTAACLAWVAMRTNWSEVVAAFGTMHLPWWLAALGVLCITQVASAVRWKLLARPFGFVASVAKFTEYYFVGMYFNLMLPTAVGGDVVRAWCLNGSQGRLRAAITTVFLDRVSGLLVLIVLACAGVAFSPIELPSWIAWFVWGTAGISVLCGFVAARMFRRGKTLTGSLERVRIRLRDLLTPHIVLTTTLWSFGVQAGNVILVWLVGKSIGSEVPASFYWILVPMVSLLTMLPLSFNGMGVREGATILFLAPLGIAEDRAVTLALLWFLVFVAASLIGGVVYLFGGIKKPQVDNTTARDMEVGHEALDSDPDQGRTRQHQASL